MPAEGVLVLSEIWFPFWRVKVDGMETPLLRTNFTFRGILLKPGHHEVTLEYHSPWIRAGLLVSLASLLGLILFAWLTVFGRSRVRSSNPSA